MPNIPRPPQGLINAKLHKVSRTIPLTSVYQQFTVRFARDVYQRVDGLENIVLVDRATAAQRSEQIQPLQHTVRTFVI